MVKQHKNPEVMGFYGILLGCYRDLMGFYSDFMGFHWDVIGNSIEVLYCFDHLSHMPIGLGFDRGFIGVLIQDGAPQLCL